MKAGRQEGRREKEKEGKKRKEGRKKKTRLEKVKLFFGKSVIRGSGC